MKKQSGQSEEDKKTDDTAESAPVNRRDFMKTACRALALAVMAVGFRRLVNLDGGEMVWQIDPKKCIHCGRCATDCVRDQSAVRCVRAFDVCGYCKLCGGYHRISSGRLDTAAENQLCPTGALVRTYIEEPFYEYRVIEELCNGCGLCAKGCTAFGNGSLYLQIRHHLCAGCNECRIAVNCPAQAISQISSRNPYVSPM
ncbi:MAG: twin-arginine translocation signal domain-containing protein [Chitinispirillales bacterium]|jgi:electron transport complex protein RnfB|nr:twin-arginine translocation signal domain-containing protein [Chitinispirillales bacterium]